MSNYQDVRVVDKLFLYQMLYLLGEVWTGYNFDEDDCDDVDLEEMVFNAKETLVYLIQKG